MPFSKAWTTFQNKADEPFKQEFQHFKNEHNWWLTDYSFYATHSKISGEKKWNKWEHGLAFRNKETMNSYSRKYSGEIEYHNFLQFMFFRHWFRLKNFANEKGIEIVGDLPLYVSHASSDVWGNQHPRLF